MQGQLPVTVVTGSQGGDAWLLERLRATSSDDRVTAIVPKGRRSSRGPGLVPTTERLVRMGQGCACCTVRGDLLTKVRKIVREGQAAHVLIQAPAHADLVTLAKTFTVADDQGKTLSSVASLQSVAVSIDTATFDSELRGKGGRGLVERIELADTIVLRGDDTAEVLTLVRALNPEARICRDDEVLSLDALRPERPFDLTAAQRRASLRELLEEGQTAPVDGVSRFAFRARRPFHPQRLFLLLVEGLGWSGALRARGAFWVASRPGAVGMLDTVMGRSTTSQGGVWWSAVPESDRPRDPRFQRQLDAIWHPTYGDRMQEIAIVSLSADAPALRAALEQCLLTDEELAHPERWPSMPHPFPWPQKTT